MASHKVFLYHTKKEIIQGNYANFWKAKIS